MSSTPRQRTYDHRLVRGVQETGDTTVATSIGVPRSTVAGWSRRAPQAVTSAPGLDAVEAELRVRVAKLERRVARLEAVLRVLFAVFRLLQPDLTRLRVPTYSRELFFRFVHEMHRLRADPAFHGLIPEVAHPTTTGIRPIFCARLGNPCLGSTGNGLR